MSYKISSDASKLKLKGSERAYEHLDLKKAANEDNNKKQNQAGGIWLRLVPFLPKMQY